MPMKEMFGLERILPVQAELSSNKRRNGPPGKETMVLSRRRRLDDEDEATVAKSIHAD
jgi:hypothetical protein